MKVEGTRRRLLVDICMLYGMVAMLIVQHISIPTIASFTFEPSALTSATC